MIAGTEERALEAPELPLVPADALPVRLEHWHKEEAPEPLQLPELNRHETVRWGRGEEDWPRVRIDAVFCIYMPAIDRSLE